MPAGRKLDLSRLLRESAGIKRLIGLRVDLADPRQVSAAVGLLTPRMGDGPLVQDVKSMVIRRLSLEAFSRSWVELKDIGLRAQRQKFYETAEKIFALLKGFPAVEHLDRYCELPAECSPQKEDGSDILRAKREGILFYLTKVISCNLTDQRVIVDIFNNSFFFELYGMEVMTLKDHALSPLTPKLIAECLKQQVLETETGLPFNIKLPD